MRDSRLVGVVADHDSRNAVTSPFGLRVRILACAHFPRKRIRVYAAIHEEPLFIPFLWYGGGSVDRKVEPEKRPVGRMVWVVRSGYYVLQFSFYRTDRTAAWASSGTTSRMEHIIIRRISANTALK